MLSISTKKHGSTARSDYVSRSKESMNSFRLVQNSY